MYPLNVSSSKPVLAIWALVVQCLVAAAVAGCSAQNPRPAGDVEDIVLHVDYRSGGDAPLGFLMTIMFDGQIRFYSPDWKTHWCQISDDDLSAIQRIIRSQEFEEATARIKATSDSFGCCDSNEVGLYLPSADRPIGIIFDSELLQPEILQELVALINQIGVSYFKNKYSVFLPKI